MNSELLIIRTSTLTKIADSIRTVRGLTVKIPTVELVSALKTGKVSVESAKEPTTRSELLISRQILTDIADAVREKIGSTADIPVSGLSAAILAAFKNAPGGDTQGTTFEISDGIDVLEENSGGGLTLIIYGYDDLIKLNSPTIYVDVEIVSKLDAPTIYLDGVILPKLDAPTIHSEIETIAKLDTPTIYLGNSAFPKLATPIITILKED